MRRLVVGLLSVVTVLPGSPVRAGTVGDARAWVVIGRDGARIGNELVERAYAWGDGVFRTTSLRDRRTGREWVGAGGSNALTLGRGPLAVDGQGWAPVRPPSASVTPGGAVLRVRLANPRFPGLEVVREVEVFAGVAGFASRTELVSILPLELDRYALDELATPVGGLRAHAVDLRGGADWRDASGYDYRADVPADPQGRLEGTAEWMDVTSPAGDGFAFLLERRNYHSSVMRFDGQRAAALVETGRDLQYLGPVEPGTAGPNPSGVPRYTRKVPPLGSLRLEPVFLALGTDPDDLPWQAYKYLRRRMRWAGPGTPTVDFNTDKVDAGAAGRGRGAKDDADFPTLLELLPVLERLGAEVLVLDDGWMPRNGDWFPDPDRFPAGLEPLLEELERRGMRLGLWMAPANFHPYARSFQANPEWSCAPVGTATGLANLADPEGERVTGSAEPGVGVWNLLGRNRAGEVFADRLRADIERLVVRYRVAKFKFDFLVWLDCANPEPVDVYQYHDAFFSRVVDPLVAAFPEVGFGLDETNDFRGFPYESILRGPTWFQNGTPPPNVLLHNVWTLAPYVPGFALGMHVLGGATTERYPVDYLVAVGMTYQPTIWKDVRQLVNPDGSSKLDPLGQPVVETARRWFDFFKARRAELSTFAYPLLDDPLDGEGWAALQPWDRDAQRGFVLAYRQRGGGAEQAIPLRGVDPARTFRLTDEVTGEELGTATGAGLRAGLQLRIDREYGFRIVRITPT